MALSALASRLAKPLAAAPATAGFAAAAGASAGYIWPLAFEYQLEQEWCWVAVGLCLARAAGRLQLGDTQCQLAASVLNADCCADHGGCDQPFGFDGVLRRLNWAFDQSSATPSAVSFDQINRLLDDGRPIVAQIRWDDGGKHLILVHGFSRTAGQTVYVRDPLFGPGGAAGLGRYDRRLSYQHLRRYTRFPEPDGDDEFDTPDSGNPVGTWEYTFHPKVV